MSKKSKVDKRNEAEQRALSYTWDNSKAKRLGKCTEAEWLAKRK